MKVLVFLALATIVVSQPIPIPKPSKLFHIMERSEIEEDIVKICGSGKVALQKRSTDELVEILKRCRDGLAIEKRDDEEEMVDLQERGWNRHGC